MKILYFECNMGAAGDMLTASLYELLSDTQQTEFLNIMNSLSDQISVHAYPAQTKGIAGTRMEVRVNGIEEDAENHPHHHTHTHTHTHTAPAAVADTIDAAPLPDAVKIHAKAVYDDIAAAESRAHGVPVTQIHFHEVGNLDAIADITGVCLAIDMLKPDRIVSSAIHVGSGEVHCAHGILPVPAPAAAYLLEGVPCYSSQVRGELCTPTGAALLAHFSDSFGPMPVMAAEKIGYGIGKREYEAANCVRAFLGNAAGNTKTGGIETDEVTELTCNIDDMTAEALSYAAGSLMKQGALDVTLSSVIMKKGRPGTQLTVLCRPEEEEHFARAVLQETTTNGVRVRRCARYILTPVYRQIETPYGIVRMKQVSAAGENGAGAVREKPEYEDIARIARETGKPFEQIHKLIAHSAEETQKHE